MVFLGFPPFLGFLPKWMTIEILMKSKFFMLTFFMIMLTIIMIFIYTKIMISTITLSKTSKTWKLTNKHQTKFLIQFNSFCFMMTIPMMTILFNSI